MLLLEKMLRRAGYASVRGTTDARQVLPLYAEFRPDLLLLDLHMPGLTGFEVLERLQGVVGPGDFFPVLVLTADTTAETRERALAGGANDFLTKPFDQTEVLLRVRNLLETRSLHRRLRDQNLPAGGAGAGADPRPGGGPAGGAGAAVAGGGVPRRRHRPAHPAGGADVGPAGPDPGAARRARWS